MSVAFSPLQIGSITVRNRFMRSATWEGCTDDDGTPTPRLAKMMVDMAEGHVGLIIPGFSNVSKAGAAFPRQNGLFDPRIAEAWDPIVAECQELGSKVMFQIGYGGVICSDGACRGPSLTFGAKSEFTEVEIEEMIEDFTKTAVNAFKIGADGVQLHAAHGYLLSLFLSPAANQRADKWGGSEEGRLRVVSEITEAIKRATDPSFAIGIKMNGDDYRPSGMTKELCGKYMSMLKGKVDLFEISCGLLLEQRSIMKKPVNSSLVQFVKNVFDPLAFRTMYNQKLAAHVKRMNPWATVATVGGVRSIREIDNTLSYRAADLVSMSRPLLREPNLVYDWEAGKKIMCDCKSCNKCITGLQTADDGIHCSYQ